MQKLNNNKLYRDLVIPLDTYLREQEETLADMLWEDANDPQAEQYQHRIDEARKLMVEGELYWVGF